MSCQLWRRTLTHFWECTLNFRALQDPPFDELLSRFRYGVPSPADIQQLNQRAAENRPLRAADSRIICYYNETRDKANRTVSYDLLQTLDQQHLRTGGRTSLQSITWRQRGCLRILADVVGSVNADVIKRVRTMKTHKDGGTLAGTLDLFLGYQVILTDKSPRNSARGVCNGTLCEVVDIMLDPEAEITIVPTAPNSSVFIHTVEARHVAGVVLRHRDSTLARVTNFPPLPAGCFPLLPVSLTLNRRLDMIGISGVSMRQIPCIQCFGSTGHSTQGCTCHRVCIAEWMPNVRGFDYTALSRVGAFER